MPACSVARTIQTNSIPEKPTMLGITDATVVVLLLLEHLGMMEMEMGQAMFVYINIVAVLGPSLEVISMEKQNLIKVATMSTCLEMEALLPLEHG